jgi:hypothetical protein
MKKTTENIRSLYTINLLEGEGVGTSYEYYAKSRKLRKFLRKIEKPTRILIAGLPEKYGLSMDSFLLAEGLGAEIVVVDERPDVLERAKSVIESLKSRGHFHHTRIRFHNAGPFLELGGKELADQRFDLALSSEVYQRLDGAEGRYVANLNRLARNIAIFAPNRGNGSHVRLSGLRSVGLEELLNGFRQGDPGWTIFDYGYVDLPPFPPGLTRSQEKREQAGKSRLETFLMKGLEIYSRTEDIIPLFLKEKFAHIIYVMATRG